MIPQYKYAIYGCNYVAKHTTWLIDYTGRIYPCAIMWQNSIHGNPIAKMQSRSIFSVHLGNSVSLSHNHKLSSNFKEFNITASSDNDKFFMNIELMLVIYIYIYIWIKSEDIYSAVFMIHVYRIMWLIQVLATKRAPDGEQFLNRVLGLWDISYNFISWTFLFLTSWGLFY